MVEFVIPEVMPTETEPTLTEEDGEDYVFPDEPMAIEDPDEDEVEAYTHKWGPWEEIDA